jgi:hypothetical protein
LGIANNQRRAVSIKAGLFFAAVVPGHFQGSDKPAFAARLNLESVTKMTGWAGKIPMRGTLALL